MKKFAISAFDRCEGLRRPPSSLIEEATRHARAQLMVFQADNVLTRKSDGGWMLSMTADRLQRLLPRDVVFLGVGSTAPQSNAISLADPPLKGEAHFPLFAVRLAKEMEQQSVAALVQSGETEGELQFTALRSMALRLNDETMFSFLSLGKSITEWHAQHQFCPQCGGATLMTEAGLHRTCTKCNACHYPRVNPCAIMIVIDVERGCCLLAKHHGRPYYSTLAGYVAQGETLEECVAREVFEETGVQVSSVRYFKSQAFPFPYQLMLGCVALASSRDITIDAKELEVARWVSREEVRKALDGAADAPFSVPPHFISNQLIRAWVDGKFETLHSQL